MAGVVKGGRGTARGSLRAERAADTRARIVAAARRRFAATGYGGTTLQAIADDAGVAVQTVYAVFGSKAGILRELRTSVVRQPVAEALYAAAIEAAPDGADAAPDGADAALALFAASIRARWEAGADIVRVHAEAAASDPALREEVEAVLARRRGGLAHLVDSIAGSLVDGLDAARATAIVDALTLPEAYLALTGPGGWSPDEYEAWLAAALRRELLGPPALRPGGSGADQAGSGAPAGLQSASTIVGSKAHSRTDTSLPPRHS